MAHVLNIDYNGGTILLNSGNYRLLEYTPSVGDGEDVTESARFEISGTAVTTIQAGIQSINNAFHLAREYQAGKTTAAVYIVYQPDGLSASGRSELVDARVVLDDQALGPMWTGKAVQFTIAWRRKNWWEGPETQIPLTNTNGSNNTAGLTVYNCSDGVGSAPNDRVNYVAIAAANVTGDAPAACRLEFTNTYNDTSRVGTLIVSHNVTSDPSNLPHILEGEDSDIGSSSATSAASGGYYQTSASWSGTSETVLWSWELPTALLNCTRGNWARLVARFAIAPDENLIRLRVKILLELSPVYTSAPIVLDAQINQELVSLQLPPYIQRTGDVYPITLQITGQHEQTGAHSLLLDFLQISPLDGYRVYKANGYYLPYNARLVDDGIEKTVYTDGRATPGAMSNYVATGKPIMLEPGRDQRLYFLWGTWTAGAVLASTATVKLYYRPRRLVI
jgi:hypothetical protein